MIVGFEIGAVRKYTYLMQLRMTCLTTLLPSIGQNVAMKPTLIEVLHGVVDAPSLLAFS